MIKKENKILLIGPFPNPISGVSLSNKKVRELLIGENKYSVGFINTSYPEFDEELGAFSFNKLIFYLKLNIKIFQILKFDKVYITPGQTFFGVLKYALFILFSSTFKKELIIHVHGNHLGSEFKLLRGVKKSIFRFLISKFDKGIVLSKSLESNLTPFLNKESIFILPNFAEENLYAEDLEIRSNELKIIYISNLMSEKGIFFLLDSLLELKKQNIQYKARIAGDIDKKFEKDILKRLKKLPNVTYLNIVKGPEKKKVLDWGNIFILPTFYKMEGQPISILEAMASKNLIITTEHAGIPDIIKNGVHGFFVTKKSSTSITKRLLYLSENKDVITNIANRNKTYFLANFSVDKFKDRFLEILFYNINLK
tara:strand:+ start:392 stop:1495 length:1104 start_codon:yes stop_codon:yes gene_type:complete